LIRVISSAGVLLEEPFLDVSDEMVDLMPNFDERGLLGMAFHPAYSTNGRFFVYYSVPLREEGPDGWNNTSRILEFVVSQDDVNRADPTSERIILEIDQPQFNHAGGTILFGQDDYLYISLGDGGGANDVGMGHLDDWYAVNAGGNAQNVTETLLGKILRIDVDGEVPYGIPADNPFVGRDGLDEIYAYGLRNPYRMSVDQLTGSLIAGDVGQGRWEEVSVIERGGNYGWNVMEGAHCFNTTNPSAERPECPEVVGPGHPDEGAPLLDPVIEYANAAQNAGLGQAVVGGVVYRGSAVPELDGQYLFGDWNDGSGGVLFVASPQETGSWPFTQATVQERGGGRLGENLMAFGQDEDGEVYLLTTTGGGPFADGNVYRVQAATSVSTEGVDELPVTALLDQNYPNPFNQPTTIRFTIPETGFVSLSVRDVLGRHVRTLVDETLPPGAHQVVWDGTDASNRPLPSGVYTYALRTSAASETRLMTLIR